MPILQNKVFLDIGCGSNKIDPSSSGLDILVTPNVNIDGLVKSRNSQLPPQLIGIVKVVNTPYIVVTKISPDFLRDHQYCLRHRKRITYKN